MGIPGRFRRPAYFVLDFRPGWFWTAAQLRELGVEATFRPTRHLGLTLGGYTNRLGSIADVDFGVLKAGGFLYLGTGRWLGDSIRLGIDGRTRLGPVEFTGQVLRGAHRGASSRLGGTWTPATRSCPGCP
jgi:hypothetical protein